MKSEIEVLSVKKSEETNVSSYFARKSTNSSSSSVCPLCEKPYDPISRRPISEESCGHTMCLQCFIFKNNQNGCVQCEENAKKENLAPGRKSIDDDFDDFDQNQLFDEWKESASISNVENPSETLNSIYDDETEDEEDIDEDEDDDDEDDDEARQPYQVQWLADVKNDAAEFSGDHVFPHTKDMLEVFDNIFGLKQVNQRCFLVQ